MEDQKDLQQKVEMTEKIVQKLEQDLTVRLYLTFVEQLRLYRELLDSEIIRNEHIVADANDHSADKEFIENESIIKDNKG